MASPLYQRVVDAIELDITTGVLRPGDPLPSITQLAVAHKVSPTTVKSALMILRSRGLVVGQQGKATYVAERPAE